MAWLMKGPMALLQLAMLMMVLFGTAALVSREVQPQLLAAFFGAGGLVLAALGVMAWLSGKSAVARRRAPGGCLRFASQAPSRLSPT